jgi:hypothetical protein
MDKSTELLTSHSGEKVLKDNYIYTQECWQMSDI